LTQWILSIVFLILPQACAVVCTTYRYDYIGLFSHVYIFFDALVFCIFSSSTGMCWGLSDIEVRVAGATVRAETRVHTIELSRLDFISAISAPEQTQLGK